MARSLICGFELGSIGEFFDSTLIGTATIQSAVKRSGGFALEVNTTTGGNNSGSLELRTAGGALTNFAYSCRFYLRIDSLPTTGTPVIIVLNGGSTVQTALVCTSGGSLGYSDGVSSHNFSTLLLSADALWHRIEVDPGVPGGANASVRVDGVEWINQPAPATMNAVTTVQIGQISGSITGTLTCYFDDLLVDDDSFSVTGFPGDSKQVLLIPTAGNSAGSWTDGAGGTGNISGSVDNIPPVGVAAATAAAKIKNAASGTALDYVATMQTYIVAGIPFGSIINAIQPICNDGEETSTATKFGGIWCASNPAQSAVVVGTGVGFDYGDATATVVGTFPTGWATHFGIVAVNPAVTLSTAPTVTVRLGTANTRVVDVDFMGLYVDYTSPPDPPYFISQPSKHYYVPSITMV